MSRMTRAERDGFMLAAHKLIVKHPGEYDVPRLAAALGLEEWQALRIVRHIRRGTDGTVFAPIAYDGRVGGFYAADTVKHAHAFEWADKHLGKCTQGAHRARLVQRERLRALPAKRWQSLDAEIDERIAADRPALEADQLELFEALAE
jgi:hypothetical protein